MTGLHWACKRGYIAMVNLLLTHNSNPNARDIYKRTPLVLAILSKDHRIFRKLLVCGARPFDEFNNHLILLNK